MNTKTKKTTAIILSAIIAIALIAYLAIGADNGTKAETSNSATDNNVETSQIAGTIDSETGTKSGIESISSEEFKKLASSGEYTVIDVRTPEEISRGKIYADALEIDFYSDNFVNEIAELSRDGKYLIYCRSGNRSGQTLEIMKKLGFVKVYDLAGGYASWPYGTNL